MKFDRRAQYSEMEAKLYMEYKRATKERAEGEGVVVSIACEADSYRVGARDQFSIFGWVVFGLQEVPSNKHEVSHKHMPKGARR